MAYTWSTVVKAAGTKVAYDHEDYVWKDEVDIPGPTKEALKLMVSACGDLVIGLIAELQLTHLPIDVQSAYCVLNAACFASTVHLCVRKD